VPWIASILGAAVLVAVLRLVRGGSTRRAA
jgi:hypothetical protein